MKQSRDCKVKSEHIDRNRCAKLTHERKYIIVYFLAAFVFGLVLVRGYGVYWDYEDEIAILWWNMHEFASNLFGENSWLAGKFTHLITASLEQEKDHGAAIYYFAAPLLYKTFGYSRYLVWRIAVYLVYFAGALGVYFCAKVIYRSRRLSLFLFSIYLFSPLPFAYGHFDNKDIGFLTFCVLTMLGALKWAEAGAADASVAPPREGGRRQRTRISASGWWCIFFSLSSALATNCKILGGLFWVMGLIYVVLETKRNVVLPAIAGFAVCFFALTPAMWKHPMEYIVWVVNSVFRFMRWGGTVKFAGALYPEGTTPWYYLGGMIVITSPVVILALIALGVGRLVISTFELRHKNNAIESQTAMPDDGMNKAKQLMGEGKASIGDEEQSHVFTLWYVLLMFLIPFLYGSLGNDIIYDEWRHFFFLWGFLVLLAGEGVVGLGSVYHALEFRRGQKGIGLRFLGAGYVAVLIVFILLQHPYEFTYTNILAGRDADERYQLDYWQVSFDSAMRVLAGSAGVFADKHVHWYQERNPELAITVGGADFYYNGYAVDYTYRSLRPDLQQVIYPGGTEVNYLFEARTYDGIAQVQDLGGYHKLFDLYSLNNDILTVWEKD